LRHREEARHGRVLDRVPDHVELVRPRSGGAADVGEQQDLEDRRQHERGDEDPEAQEAEQRAVADQPADEEDAQRLHVNESVARRLAESITVPSTAIPSRTYTAARPKHIATSAQPLPPNAPAWIARI